MTDPGEIQLPNLTLEQIDHITASRLNSLRDVDRIPYSIYRAMCFVAVRFTVEVALVRPSEDDELGAEVLLTQRPVDDEDIPNQWHIPGVGVNANDPVLHYHDNHAAIGRVFEEVGGDLQIAEEPRILDTVRRIGSGRKEVTTQYWAEVLGGQEENGKFYGMNEVLKSPPEGGLVTTHDATIKRVAEAYQTLRAGK